MKVGAHGALYWMLVCLVLAFAAAGCRRTAAVATLEASQGEVLAAVASSANAWKAAAVGALFQLGDALQTKHAAEAILALDDGSKLRVRQDTIVRFANTRPAKGGHAFDVDTGEVLFEAGADGVMLSTGIGLARLEAHGQVVIRRAANGTQYEVTVGKAHFESAEGVEVVEAGRSVLVNIGGAVVEDAARDASAPRVSASSSADADTVPVSETETVGISALVMGNGVSQRLAKERKFQAVPPGATQIARGTTMRVDPGSSVEIQHAGAKMSMVGSGTYLIGGGDSPVQVESGNLSVLGATRIVVPGGVIETADNTFAALESLGKSRTRVRVGKGSAMVKTATGSTRISAGEEATLSGDGVTKVAGQSLGYADIATEIGESFTVHDPKPPTAIRFQFGSRCPTRGVVRVRGKAGGQFASGEGSAALALGLGRHDYTLQCLSDQGHGDATVARGTITVLMDAGTRPMPTSPPSTSVTVDGRNYTVMYQNQLPRVTVVWPNAPPATSYTLKVESRGGTKTYAASTPSYSFASGALPEGRHSVSFEGGGKISRYTGVEITFDNAAPTASLSTPSEIELGRGGEMVIAGVAQPGWTVEVGGEKITQDGKQRFSQGVKVPTTDRAVGVRLTHPTRGTHVYVRRAARGHD